MHGWFGPHDWIYSYLSCHKQYAQIASFIKAELDLLQFSRESQTTRNGKYILVTRVCVSVCVCVCVFVCVSVSVCPSPRPTLVHGPECNLGNGRGCPLYAVVRICNWCTGFVSLL